MTRRSFFKGLALASVARMVCPTVLMASAAPRDLLALPEGYVVVEGEKLARAMGLIHMPAPILSHNGRYIHATTRLAPVEILGHLEAVDYEDFAQAVAKRLPAGTTHVCRVYITTVFRSMSLHDEGQGIRFVYAFCAKVPA